MSPNDKEINDAIMLYEKALVHQQSGEIDNAIKCYKDAISKNPNLWQAQNNLANLALYKGEYGEAMYLYEKALELNPENPIIQNNIGNVLIGQKKFQEAKKWFSKSLKKDPNYVEAISNFGLCLAEENKIDEAETYFRKAIKINPSFSNAYNNLAMILKKKEKFYEAVKEYENAIKFNPNFSDAYCNLAISLMDIGKINEAETNFLQALKADPNNVHTKISYAGFLKTSGKIDQATKLYQSIISENPDIDAELYRNFAHTKTFSREDQDIRRMELIIKKNNLDKHSKTHLCFALGKAYEDLGQIEKSFNYIKEGNAIVRKTYQYDTNDMKKYFNNIVDIFQPDLIDKFRNSGLGEKNHIFILGMPRSGTSLVEQILSSHTKVCGGGEIKYVEDSITEVGKKRQSTYPESVKTFSPADLAEIGSLYLNKTKQFLGSKEFLTNKLPQNFLYLGIIKLIFPKSKIIHCTRDPLDNCISLYKNYFVGHQGYAYDLEELGAYYNLYKKLMKHWHKLFPDGFFEIHYDNLVKDQKDQTLQLLKFCQLDWEENCLAFHKTKRIVNTASSVQIRKPIYKDSLEIAKKYKDLILPLANILKEN